MAPDFGLESLDGKTVRLSDFRGKAVLLNFWATWCQPCKIEMPWFEQLQKQYAHEGLQVIGVAMDDASKEDIAKFAKNLGVDYPILLGKENVGDAYGGVQFLPATFDLAWSGVTRSVLGFSDPVNQFAGDFFESSASIQVTVHTNPSTGHGFRFVSSATTAVNFAQFEREHNGVFF